MRIKSLVDEDFVNYKKPVMLIGTCFCNGKCCIEAGIPLSICQNDATRRAPIKDVPNAVLIDRYLRNPITQGICFGGLEPMEQFDELIAFIKEFRNKCQDDVVIYTGYKEEEIEKEIASLRSLGNVVLKLGRYIPDRAPRFDEVLGIRLASDNQYGKKLS